MTPFVLLFAAALSAGNAEFESKANELAAEIAVARLRTEIAEKGLVSNVLERAMLDRPDAFRTRSEAETLCRTIYTNALDRIYREQTSAISRELRVEPSTPSLDAKTLDDVSKRHFDKTFERERSSACRTQARTIALKVKPDEADLESKDDAEARTWLTDRIANARGMTVFEENLQYISEKIVDPVLADARRERKRQQEYLMRTRCDALAPDLLAKGLETNLRKNVAERNAKCPDPLKAWGVFPATLKAELPVAVERRLVGLVLKDVDDVPFPVDEGAIRSLLTTNTAAHRAASQSEAIFRELLAKRLAAAALGKAISDAPESERAAFATFVGEHAASPEVVKAVETRVRREALPKWRSVRTAVAKVSAETRWPTLADRTWYPDAELADRTAARSDYAQAVGDWRREPELNTLAGPDTPMLEESDQAANDSVAAAFELARNAIAAQKTIVNEAHPRILAAAKDPSLGVFEKKPDLAAVTDLLTKTVEERWSEKRLRILWGDRPQPKNAAEQHAQLFPSVKREIELVARQILEEMEKEEAKEKEESEAKAKAKSDAEGEEEKKQEAQPPKDPPPEEPPPEEPPPEETPPQEEEPKEELCTISFEVGGGEVTVSAKRGSRLVAERKTKATAKGFEDAVREVGAIVGREIFKLK